MPRVSWALITLSELGTRPVGLTQVATQVGLAADEALRLLRLTWREKLALRDGAIHLDATPDGPRRYQVSVDGTADGHPVGSGKGCSVDMYLPASRTASRSTRKPYARPQPITIDITPERVGRIDPPTAVVAVTALDVDITGGSDHTDAEICSQQPFFSAADAATEWTARHPYGRLIPVRDFHTEAHRLVDWLEATPPSHAPTP